ncbi:MAG: hypothetical protein BA865_15185 [Desulfobacterales bacterium S5133MH4]|nr:MAG: hypothetical protein BA865_15185 [Desulfobacterales bacterium S5133MH4]
MKRLSFSIILILLIIAASNSPQAKVRGVCSNCHTMHNSQGGAPLARGDQAWGGTGGVTDARPNLLVASCIGCHSSTGTDTIITYNGIDFPIVYNTSEPTTNLLAGGNFYWVSMDCIGLNCGNAKGHNVLGISERDPLPLAPGGFNCGGANCHVSLAVPPTNTSIGLGGCQGCHLRPAHHADDSNVVVGSEVGDDDGFYRFLSGHFSGDTHGVCGIEDDDWQAVCGAGDHNEYLGFSGYKEDVGSFFHIGHHTMTAFCCGCHGEFHIEQSSGEWIRHPSDAVIPNEGEYQSAFSAGYDPLVPVARPSLSTVSPTVEIGTDMVMCLSCHRPHGSPYYKLMRWDYKNWPGSGYDGCGKCHTSKN